MNKKPFFSIIIPTYNRASDLQFALYCILRQNFLDFEIIISDNYSIDNTQEIVNSFKDKRIHYFKNKKNIGVTLNYKKALEYTNGTYIFLHSDDDFLLYVNSLEKIYSIIKEYNPGYIRANYICLSPNKKRIFDFKANKSLIKDNFLKPFSENKNIIQFILNSDSAFVTGLIFKNSFPSNITILNTQPISWIEILFYVGKKYGAYFINEPQIIASWSKLKIKKNGYNLLYSLTDGKLASESYLNAVKKKLDIKTYNEFLRNQMLGIYVQRFPLVKLFVGNKNMLQLFKRMRELDPKITSSFSYWIYLTLSLLTPSFLIVIIKNTFLSLYIRYSKVNNNKQIMTSLNKLKEEYIHFLEDASPTTRS